jgi:ABC-type dipeptide/oligopeptide/nickel transport system ATPase component
VSETLLRVEALRTGFATAGGLLRAVDGVDLELPAGGTLGVVGESGSGKSVTALSIMRLVDRPGRVEPGSKILFEGRDLAKLSESEMSAIRGNEVSMIFQEPMTSLNPVFTVGDQIAEAVELHQGLGKRDATARAVEMMRLVGIPSAERRVNDYPHQLSGGMRQRSAIARAFVTDPGMLLMDEPLAALDAQNRVILQAELVRIWERTRKTVIYITHSIEEALLLGDRTVVMTAQPGRIKKIIDVPFPRPRDLMTLSASPEFGRLKLDIWQVLEDEVTRARAEEET